MNISEEIPGKVLAKFSGIIADISKIIPRGIPEIVLTGIPECIPGDALGKNPKKTSGGFHGKISERISLEIPNGNSVGHFMINYRRNI